jgi:hypothetical protein
MQATATGIPMDLCNETQQTFQTKKGFNQQNLGPSTGPGTGKAWAMKQQRLVLHGSSTDQKLPKRLAPDLTNLTNWKKPRTEAPGFECLVVDISDFSIIE